MHIYLSVCIMWINTYLYIRVCVYAYIKQCMYTCACSTSCVFSFKICTSALIFFDVHAFLCECVHIIFVHVYVHVYVCVRVYTCACSSACVWFYMYICVSMFRCAFEFICMQLLYLHVRMFMCMFVCVHTCVFQTMCIHICLSICMHLGFFNLYIWVNMLKSASFFIWMCVYYIRICVCACSSSCVCFLGVFVLYSHMLMCMRVRLYACVHVCTKQYVYTCAYSSACVCPFFKYVHLRIYAWITLTCSERRDITIIEFDLWC